MKVKEVWASYSEDNLWIRKLGTTEHYPIVIYVNDVCDTPFARMAYSDGRIEYLNLYNTIAWGYTPIE